MNRYLHIKEAVKIHLIVAIVPYEQELAQQLGGREIAYDATLNRRSQSEQVAPPFLN